MLRALIQPFVTDIIELRQALDRLAAAWDPCAGRNIEVPTIVFQAVVTRRNVLARLLAPAERPTESLVGRKLAKSAFGEDFAMDDHVALHLSADFNDSPVAIGRVVGLSMEHVISIYLVLLDAPIEGCDYRAVTWQNTLMRRLRPSTSASE